MKQLSLALWLLLCIAGVVPVTADICTLDAVPAATLLLPYFEVDLDDPAGVTTLFSLGNVDAAPQMTKVTFWTDLSVPTLSFNVYLTGYDIVTVNLRDVFTTGTIPKTGEGVIPAGGISLPNVAFPNCDSPVPDLLPLTMEHIRAMHTGKESPRELSCGGTNRGNNVAVGYLTIDNVNQCNVFIPIDTGYFGTGGVATDSNTLWGDVFYVDPGNNFAQSEALIALEADASLEGGAGGPNQGSPNGVGYTFYGRYVAATGVDHREPLATTYAVRYLNGGAFTGGTELICWRDTGITQHNFTCGTTPLPYPMGQSEIIVFDEDENPQFLEEPIRPCPYAVTRVKVGGPAFPVPFDFGWIYMNLSTTTSGFFDPYKQAWVAQIHDASGLFSVGHSGLALDSACQPNQILLPVEGNGSGLPSGSAHP
jgi:hypothetical protein